MWARSPDQGETCGICGNPAPMHVCAHCDRNCPGFWCRICATLATQFSRIP